MKTTIGMLACLVCVAGSLCLADDPRPTTTTVAAGGVVTDRQPSPGLLEDNPLPVIKPSAIEHRRPRPVRVKMREGTIIFHRLAHIRKEPKGKWWVIPDARAGMLRLLPCRLLEAIEDIHARRPDTEFKITGEVCRYRKAYYLLPRHVLEVPVEGEAKPVGPTAAGKPPGDDGGDADAPYASAADVAKELLKGTRYKPIIAPANGTGRQGEGGASVPPAKKPLPIGPSRMIVRRLVRLTRSKEPGWYAITFVSDNTLLEPPMRALPNLQLQRMARLAGGGRAIGATFYVTGDVEVYRGTDYILLRNVIRRRNMGQF